MRTLRFLIPIFLLVALASCAFSQDRVTDPNHEAYGERCPSLHSANATTLLQYLNNNKPSSDNGMCVTWAIDALGDARYEPAIPALVALLDFREPSGVVRIWNHLPDGPYPAVDALERIGRPSLPALLTAMEAPATSPIAQANAVEAWILIYRITDKKSHGFAALRREANSATDDKVKKRLGDIIQRGLQNWCPNGAPGASCRQAAQDGIDR